MIAGMALLVIIGLATPAHAVQIDPYEYQEPTSTTCVAERPGMTRSVQWLRENRAWTPAWSGTYCAAGEANIHNEGRAIDWGLDVRNEDQRARAEDLVYTLLAPDVEGNQHSLARRMGVQEIIWNDQAWDARLGDGGMVPYFEGGPNDTCWNIDRSSRLYTDMHCDHVHIALNASGANETSTFWNLQYTQRSDSTMYVTDEDNQTGVGRPIYGRPRDDRLGLSGDKPITGDWNGDGKTDIGVVRGSTWYLRASVSTGKADVVFTYGNPSDVPVVGDWDGDGIDTPGVFRRSNRTWYLRNSNTSGIGEIEIAYGWPDDQPVVGDWDGDGIDTPGVFRASETRWWLKNTLDPNNLASISFQWGRLVDRAIAGDWNGDGIDTPGVFWDENGAGRWYLRNNNNPDDRAGRTYLLGNSTDRPIAGDWNGNYTDTIGVARRY